MDVGLDSVEEILGAKGRATVALFERSGDWLSAFGPDAAFVAAHFFRSPAYLKAVTMRSGSSVEAIDVKRRLLSPLLQKLLVELQSRVEIYRLDGGNFVLSAKASPGNMEEVEELMDGVGGEGGEGVLAVLLGGALTSAALLSLDGLSLQLATFHDGPQAANLKGLIAQVNPKEVLLPASETPEYDALAKYLGDQLIFTTRPKMGLFNATGVTEDLDKLLKFPSAEMCKAVQLSWASFICQNGSQGPLFSGVVAENPEAVRCAGAAVRYLEAMRRESLLGRVRASALPPPGSTLLLHPAALRALDVLPAAAGAQDGSLFKLLNRCASSSGQRQLERWLRQPSTDLRVVEERLDAVEALLGAPVGRARLRLTALARLPDLMAIQRRFVRAKAGLQARDESTLQDCYRVYQVLRLLTQVVEAVEGIAAESEPRLQASIRELIIDPIKDSAASMEKLASLVETTVDVEAIESEREFRIRPDFDANLGDLAAQLSGLEEEMRTALDTIAARLGLVSGKTVRLEVSGPQGPAFRVTMKEEKALRGVPGIRRLDALKAGVRFTNEGLSRLASAHAELKASYDETSKDILAHILGVAGSYSEALTTLSTHLGVADVLCALAEAADSAQPPYVRPKLSPLGGRRRLSLKGLRHPVVEAEDEASFIPNDVALDGESEALLVLTGPNMGGKSTYLRSVGLAVVMAQIGSFLPCESAELSLCDGVFTRIGASDDEGRGISTFMAEMLETAVILEGAGRDSLVIVDEVGRGTSTWDGVGLSWAIAEQLLLQNKALTLFATHLHQLTRLGDEHANVHNRHVTSLIHEARLTLLYKIADGPCDESFGLNVAEMLQFPPKVIEHARELIQASAKVTEEMDQGKYDMVKLRSLVEMGDAFAIRQILSQ